MTPQMTPNRIPWSRRRRPMVAALIVAAALAAGAIALGFGGNGGGTDQLSPAETAERARTFSGSVALPLVAAFERETAVDTMALSPDARASLETNLEAGDIALAWLAIWDDQAADGDRVQVAANGFSLDLDLYKAPHRIAIPVASTGGGVMTLTGLHDGGGGITVGIQTLRGTVLTPVMAPGQVLSIGLR